MIWPTALQTRVATRSQASPWRSLPSVQWSASDRKTAEKLMVREAMPVSGRGMYRWLIGTSISGSDLLSAVNEAARNRPGS